MRSIQMTVTRWNRCLRSAAGAFCAAGLLLIAAPRALADKYVTMAPPVQSNQPSSWTAETPGNASASSVFNWSEVPQDQQVPITRAAFDQSGYQLFDEAGETILVPFTNGNLYVMQFAVSPDGNTFFVNNGSAPVLYLPKNGYLINATVPGARWYPLSDGFQPTRPVYVGMAPSWTAFVHMGWYPDMYCHGGYWCNEPFINVGVVFPSRGFCLSIGTSFFYGWEPYRRYYAYHPAPYHITFYDNDERDYERYHHDDYRSFYGGRNFDGNSGFTVSPGPRYGRIANDNRDYSTGHVFLGRPVARDNNDLAGNRFLNGGSGNYTGRPLVAIGQPRERTFRGAQVPETGSYIASQRVVTISPAPFLGGREIDSQQRIGGFQGGHFSADPGRTFQSMPTQSVPSHFGNSGGSRSFDNAPVRNIPSGGGSNFGGFHATSDGAPHSSAQRSEQAGSSGGRTYSNTSGGNSHDFGGGHR